MRRWIAFFLLTFVMVGVLVVFISTRAKYSNPYTINIGQTTVIKQLRSLNRLETASFTIEKIIDAGTSGGKFEEFLFGDKILLIAHGEVIAGIDLANLDDNAVTIEGSTLRLALPAPQILVTRLDNEQTRVYDRRQGLLSKGDKNLESEARKAAEQTIKDAACKGGILQQATDNARKQLTTLLKSLQFTTVIITIPSGSC
jgi:hypothetical protein